jgi:hypothetical protein
MAEVAVMYYLFGLCFATLSSRALSALTLEAELIFHSVLLGAFRKYPLGRNSYLFFFNSKVKVDYVSFKPF